MHINVDMNPTTTHSSSSPIRSTKMSPVIRKSVVIAIALCVFVTNAYEHIEHIGCFKDSEENRLMEYADGYDYESLTIEVCAKSCDGKQFFGLQSGNECWCTDEFNGDGVNPGVCDMDCLGDESEVCGGALSMGVYKMLQWPPIVPPDEHIGCFKDLDNSLMEILGDTESFLSIYTCEMVCSNYNFLGIKNGKECWCSDEFDDYGFEEGFCNIRCSGDFGETLCGGEYSMDVYNVLKEPVDVEPTDGTVYVEPTEEPIEEPIEEPVEEPTEEPIEGTVDEEPGYDHIGCFQDSLGNRLMEFNFEDEDDMSIEACVMHCYRFFGLQNGNECWCADEFIGGVNPGVCDTNCSGDQSEICGGNLSMDVYEFRGIR